MISHTQVPSEDRRSATWMLDVWHCNDFEWVGIRRGAWSLLRSPKQPSPQMWMSESLQIVSSQAGSIEYTHTTASRWGLERHSTICGFSGVSQMWCREERGFLKLEEVWEPSLWLWELLPKPGDTTILLPYAAKLLAVPCWSAYPQEQLRVAVLPCGLNHSLARFLSCWHTGSCIPRVSIRGFIWKKHRCKLQKSVSHHAGFN